MVGQATGEVAFHDDRNASGQVPLYVIDRGEQCGEVEAHPGLSVLLLVHHAAQRLVEGRYGRDESSLTGLGQHGGDGRLAGATEPFDALERWVVRHGRTPHPGPPRSAHP